MFSTSLYHVRPNVDLRSNLKKWFFIQKLIIIFCLSMLTAKIRENDCSLTNKNHVCANAPTHAFLQLMLSMYSLQKLFLTWFSKLEFSISKCFKSFVLFKSFPHVFVHISVHASAHICAHAPGYAFAHISAHASSHISAHVFLDLFCTGIDFKTFSIWKFQKPMLFFTSLRIYLPRYMRMHLCT